MTMIIAGCVVTFANCDRTVGMVNYHMFPMCVQLHWPIIILVNERECSIGVTFCCLRSRWATICDVGL